MHSPFQFPTPKRLQQIGSIGHLALFEKKKEKKIQNFTIMYTCYYSSQESLQKPPSSCSLPSPNPNLSASQELRRNQRRSSAVEQSTTMQTCREWRKADPTQSLLPKSPTQSTCPPPVQTVSRSLTRLGPAWSASLATCPGSDRPRMN